MTSRNGSPSPVAISPRRIVRSLKNPPACVTQLVQLDSSSAPKSRRFSAILNGDNSMSEVISCVVDDTGEVSMSSFFPHADRSANNAMRKSKSMRRRKSGGREADSSVLSYSGTQMSYSTASSGSDSSAESDCTLISESVPSCSLTIMENSRTNAAGPAAARFRKPLRRVTSNSFSSIFGKDIDPFDGRSTHLAEGSKSRMSNSCKYEPPGSNGGYLGATNRPDDVMSDSAVRSSRDDFASGFRSDYNRRDSTEKNNSNHSTVGNVSSKNNTSNSGNVPTEKETRKSVSRSGALSEGALPSKLESEPSTAAGSPDGGLKVTNVERLGRIGRGSYGDVYKGRDLDTGRIIAIKEILVSKDFTKDMEKQLETLEREISVMRKLHHPNIINYLGAGRDDNCLSIYMEYIGGGSIGDVLKGEGPFTEERARNYTTQLLNGLLYLHDRKILHRDLKGDNLFLTEEGILKVGDFGTSKELVTTLVTDSVAGTPNFMAPEVIACSGHSYAADIWSVGCCVLEMLTAAPPFNKLDNHMAVMFAIMKGKFESEIPENISEDAKSFIRACTMFAVEDRWTANQLIEHPWLRLNDAKKKKNDSTEHPEAPTAVSPSSPMRDLQRRKSVVQAFRGNKATTNSGAEPSNPSAATTKTSSKGQESPPKKSNANSPPKNQGHSGGSPKEKGVAPSPNAPKESSRGHLSDKIKKAKSLDVDALQNVENEDNCGVTSSNGEDSPKKSSPRMHKNGSSNKSGGSAAGKKKRSESPGGIKLRPHPPSTGAPSEMNHKRGSSGPYSVTATSRANHREEVPTTPVPKTTRAPPSASSAPRPGSRAPSGKNRKQKS